MNSSSVLSIRPATADDASSVARLAALDSARVPDGDLLLGVVDGCSVAAVSVRTGATVANPFTPTADVVGLLHQRAARLRGDAPATPLRSASRLLRRRGVATA